MARSAPPRTLPGLDAARQPPPGPKRRQSPCLRRKTDANGLFSALPRYGLRCRIHDLASQKSLDSGPESQNAYLSPRIHQPPVSAAAARKWRLYRGGAASARIASLNLERSKRQARPLHRRGSANKLRIAESQMQHSVGTASRQTVSCAR